MNTFDDDNELDFFQERRRRPPRERDRRGEKGGSRRPGPPPGSDGVARLAGLVALGIAIVLGFVFWIGSCGSQTKRDYSSYLTRMQPLAQDSANVGQEFANAIGSPSLTLQSFESDLANWSKQEQTDYAAAQKIQPPALLQSAHAEALATFQLRAIGLVGLANTLAQAKSKRDSPSTAAAALAAQAQLLNSSDVLWEELFKLPATETLSQQGVTGVIAPSSQIATNSDIVSARSLAIVYERLGNASTGGGGGGGNVSGPHGSALLSTEATENGKTTILSESTPVTIPVGSSLVIGVTFADSGSYPEVRIKVTLVVKVSGTSVYTKTETVSQIASKARTTVSFSALQLPPKAFGASATISVNIGKVPGEVRLDNNSATYPVLFRLAPS